MTYELSRYTKSGDAKAVPFALFDRAKEERFKVNVFTGASLGSDLDKMFAESEIVNKRLPFQSDRAMRKKINEGSHLYYDQHLSNTAEYIRSGVLPKIDYAIIEAISITKYGMIIPTTSVVIFLLFVNQSDNINVDINIVHSY